MLVAQHGTEHPEVNTVKHGGRGPFNLCPLRFEEPNGSNTSGCATSRGYCFSRLSAARAPGSWIRRGSRIRLHRVRPWLPWPPPRIRVIPPTVRTCPPTQRRARRTSPARSRVGSAVSGQSCGPFPGLPYCLPGKKMLEELRPRYGVAFTVQPAQGRTWAHGLGGPFRSSRLRPPTWEGGARSQGPHHTS